MNREKVLCFTLTFFLGIGSSFVHAQQFISYNAKEFTTNETEKQPKEAALPYEEVEIKESIPEELEKTSIAKRTKGFFGTIGFLLNDQDTNYIEPNHYLFTLMIENSIWHEQYDLSANGQSLRFAPNLSYKLGPYIGWSFIFLGWAWDVSTIFGSSSDKQRQEFSLNVYSSLIGGDIYFRKNQNSFRLYQLDGFSDELNAFDEKVNGFSVDIQGINLYYIFNHRRFSYPAAYSQSTQQKHSAGSFIAGASYSSHKLHLSTEKLPTEIQEALTGSSLNFNDIYYKDYALQFGYTYNWVFAKNCLANISFSPAVAYKQSHLKSDEEESMPIRRKINLDFIGRAAIVWNTGRLYAGASWVYNNFDYRTKDVTLHSGFGTARLYAGMNFGLKKRYRNKTKSKSIWKNLKQNL